MAPIYLGAVICVAILCLIPVVKNQWLSSQEAYTTFHRKEIDLRPGNYQLVTNVREWHAELSAQEFTKLSHGRSIALYPLNNGMGQTLTYLISIEGIVYRYQKGVDLGFASSQPELTGNTLVYTRSTVAWQWYLYNFLLGFLQVISYCGIVLGIVTFLGWLDCYWNPYSKPSH